MNQNSKVSESKKRMFYRLLNHLKHKSSLSDSTIPIEYLTIISKFEAKKIPCKGDLLTEQNFRKND